MRSDVTHGLCGWEGNLCVSPERWAAQLALPPGSSWWHVGARGLWPREGPGVPPSSHPKPAQEVGTQAESMEIGSQSHSGRRRTLRPPCPTPTHPTVPISHIPQCHISTVLEHLQGQGFHHLPGQPISMHYHSFGEEFFPTIQPDPPLVQLNFII